MLHNQHKHLLVANRVAFMVIGVLEAAWAPLVPYVKSAFAMDEGTLGLLMLCSGFGSICALPLSGFLVNRFGAKKVVYVSGLLMAFALLTISLLINMWLTGVMLMVFGSCTITIDVAANMNGIAIERKTGRHLMSGFHGGYSLGTLIGAGAMSVLFTLGLIPKWAVVICMVFTLLALAFGCRDLLSKESLMPATPIEKPRKSKLYIPPMVVVVGLLCFIMYAAEGAVMGWSAIFVSQERGINISIAGFFYTAFAVAMTIMRLCGDKIVDRLGQRVVVAGGALLISVGFMIVVLIDSTIAAVAGFAMVGFGAANVVPQFVSFTAHIKGMATHNIISFINALGYSGILLGPVIIGFVGKQYGLHISFGGIAVFALIVAVVSSIVLKTKQIRL
ncbi:putative MFS family arabinose efflux permease [Parabacteroides sp. PFB2-12]|uniref:MFS transporter n=1 Tax=unclassified Parabacteroides TaxID=2649774 RepID=UPI002474D1C8|nr:MULTISPECIES: MFS transporter [unclassified Parabacteroides]MDH6342504.1 putative MFS family arabinose efflux permease [Parabacteroides sp. PM6-13]MDH6390156.1 putative MFS family arabinose efflux permease [Parabacteroides sp. PFB2-12]